jgi:GMP synthase (glutamine-hydrolysing)
MSLRSNSGQNVLPFPGRSASAAFNPAPLRPVLIVLHQETSTPGRVGNALRALGYPLDIRRPRFGDPLPETLELHAGAVIFGGPMSANDPDDYVRREIDWIEIPLREQRPFLGICLGAQMLAKQLGAAVAPHHEGRVEVGYYPIRPTAAGHALCPDWPERVYHWHGEGFQLPGGAELLAEGDDFPVQAFQSCHAFGFQFHPDDASLDHARMRAHGFAGRTAASSPLRRPRGARRDRTRLAEEFHRRLDHAHAARGSARSRGIAATRNLSAPPNGFQDPPM